MDRRPGRTGISWWLPGALALASCSAPPPPGSNAPGDAKEAVQIGAYERPEALVADASRRLADVITAEDVGHDFGVPEAKVPYADSYWPFVMGGANAVWNRHGLDPRPPITKYMLISNPSQRKEAETWERQFHGPLVPGVEIWHGHCGGWAAAATTNAPILHPVFATSDGHGGIVACHEGEAGCVRFEIGDVNALMAEIYLDGPSAFIGSTCGVPADAIPRDTFGRVLARGCDGVNAGSLLVTVSTLLKRHGVPFTIDVQKPTTTDEVWNQPAFQYHVYDFHPISSADAVSLVEHGSSGSPAGASARYPWDPAARGFAFVDLGLRFVGEHGPNVTFVPGTRSAYELRMAAVIELDADASDPRATILGGEYLDLPQGRADRLHVVPYAWVSHGPGPEVLPPDVGAEHHNPFVLPSLVRTLMELGQK